MSDVPMIPCAQQSIDDSDIALVAKALKGPSITRGQQVRFFERELAAACQVPHAIAFSSGSTALWGACLALNIGSDDRIFVPANTFIATASFGHLCGAQLHFVDVDPLSGLLSVQHLKQLLKILPPKRSFLFPVHFAGRCVDLTPLKKAIGNESIVIVEDSSHALGTELDQQNPVGSCLNSRCSTFSFHASKNITTGEGGAVTTRDPELASRLRLIRNSGIQRDLPWEGNQIHPWLYSIDELSCNFHMTDFAAALGRSQLKRLQCFGARKRRAIAHYIDRLKGLPHLQIPYQSPDQRVNFHLFFVLIDFAALRRSRVELMLYLKKENIGTGVHYIPLYQHNCWKNKRSDRVPDLTPLKGCEQYYSKTLSLPLFADITETDIDRVCLKLKSWLVGN